MRLLFLGAKTLPRYCKHRASGQAVVTLNGRDLYFGRYGSRVSHLEYVRLIVEWLAHGRRLPSQTDQELLSVAELIAGFWRHGQVHHRKEERATSQLEIYKVIL